MATEDKETLTIRLPKGLKELVDKAAEDRETTVTSIVREALQENLYPAVRMYEHPGLTKRFDDFVEKAVNKQVILLVADASTGRRYFLSGTLLLRPSNESLVALGRVGHPGWIIPRSDVVAWFEGTPGELKELEVSLARQGWAPRSAA